MSSTPKTDKGHIDYRRRLCHPAWSQEEIEAIEELAKIKDMPLAMVVRQAVRSYQLAAANQPNPVQ
jgi:predicted NAD/FAD-binding protein